MNIFLKKWEYKKRVHSTRIFMAQEQGFEPWHRVNDLLAFQASPFSHLCILASN